MSIGQTLRDLLAPLGVYRWEGSFQWGELQSEGAALVEETEDPLKLTVSFPDTGGVPDDFARRQQVIEKLLPCHVLVEYQFQYMTWTLLEGRFLSWEQLEETGATWKTFEAQTL